MTFPLTPPPANDAGRGPAAAAISCDGVSFAYKDGSLATDGVDLAIRPGELLCLLGPNGAGKTTLIRQITGELRPTAGAVRIFGRDPARAQRETRARLGVIPQHVALFESLTVRQHLVHFAGLRGLRPAAAAAAVARTLATCGLEAFVDKRAGALSGGQQRSALFALALLGDPDILILDEPTVGLDPAARRALWSVIEDQRRLGKAILLTTHYLDEAERLATRIGFLAKGRLTHQGRLDDLRALLGGRVKLAAGAHGPSELVDSVEAAEALARGRGLSAYSIAPVTLEDVYFQLAGDAALIPEAAE
jgi:ABC-2 type transport system ATP-binding protein